jgi:hypothetical protein
MGPPNGKSFRITVMDVLRLKDSKFVEDWASQTASRCQLGLLPQKQPQVAWNSLKNNGTGEKPVSSFCPRLILRKADNTVRKLQTSKLQNWVES